MDEPAQRKRKAAPILVLPAETAPLSEQDRRQAVTALAKMIAAWWKDRHPDQEP
jgi:hypothetical protein